MSSSSRVASVWIALILGALLYFSINNQWEIESDILSLLPESELEMGFKDAEKKYFGNITRNVVFAVVADDWTTAKSTANVFSRELAKSGFVENLKFQTLDYKGLWNNYFPFRERLLNDQQIHLIRDGKTDTLSSNMLARLYSPFGSLNSTLLEVDPLGLFSTFLTSLKPSTRLQDLEGYLSVENNGRTGIFISAKINKNFNSISGHREFIDFVNRMEITLFKPKNSELLRAGHVFYSEAGSRSAISEISTIGLGSIIGVLLIFIVVFKSIWPISLSVIMLGTSLSMAFLGTHVIFGSIHMFTLVVGASLVGLAIDYSIHFFSQRFNARLNNGIQVRKWIKKPLLVSFMSTCLGFISLILMPFPGLVQVAVFFIIGLTTSLIFVLLIFPLIKHQKLSTFANWNIFSKVPCFWLKLSRRQILLLLAPLSALAVTLIFFSEFDDDVRQLQALNPSLKKQEEQIVRLAGSKSNSSFFIVRGETTEQLLQAEEGLRAQLGAIEVAGVQALSKWIPSEKRQSESLTLYPLLKKEEDKITKFIKAKPQLAKKIPSANDAIPEKLNVDSFLEILPGPITDQWLGQIDSKYYSILSFEDSGGIPALSNLEDGQIRFVSRADSISKVLKSLREKFLIGGLVGIVLVFFGLNYFYSPINAFRIAFPPLLSATLGVGLSFIVVGHLNIFNVFSMLLVVALGIDYAIFYSEKTLEESLPSFIGISLSLITSLLAFGLMSFSSTQAIAGFGMTLVFGLAGCYLLSPFAARNHL